VHSNLASPPPCDVSLVDFSGEIVLVGTLGPQPDDCHAAKLDCVDEVGASGRLRAVLTREVPGPGCTCNAVVVHPAVAVKVDLPTTTVRILYESIILDCP
jgi:hypothetical protein